MYLYLVYNCYVTMLDELGRDLLLLHYAGDENEKHVIESRK